MENTSNYGLKRWDSEDRILMEEFNSDNEKIDAALKASEDKAAAPADTTAAQASDTAAESTESSAKDNSKGLGLLAAGLVTGLAGIGGGIAVAAGAPAAIAATSEDPKAFGKALIFVALGESIALYGVVISILILNKV